MEIQYFGANCFKINTKKSTVVTDDNLAKLGLKSITKPDDVLLKTNNSMPAHQSQFTADMPGEYEVADVVIKGIGVRGHMEEKGNTGSTIFLITSGDTTVAVLGHIHPDLTEQQLESIGHVDVAIVPVGGNGYTLDGVGALSVIKKLEPRAVVPAHYADKAVKYEVPQAELTDAIKALAMEPAETVAKYKPKISEMTDSTVLVVLERQG